MNYITRIILIILAICTGITHAACGHISPADSATGSTAIAESASYHSLCQLDSVATPPTVIAETASFHTIYGTDLDPTATDTTREVSPLPCSDTHSTHAITHSPAPPLRTVAPLSPATEATGDTPSCSICDTPHTKYYRCPFISTERTAAATVCPSDVLPRLKGKRPRTYDPEEEDARATKIFCPLQKKQSKILNKCFSYCENYVKKEKVPCPVYSCPFATEYGAQNRHNALKRHIQKNHRKFPTHTQAQALKVKTTYAAEMDRRAKMKGKKS